MIFAIHSPFLLPFFLGGKRKSVKKNQNRDFKSCLSARSCLIFSFITLPEALVLFRRGTWIIGISLLPKIPTVYRDWLRSLNSQRTN